MTHIWKKFGLFLSMVTILSLPIQTVVAQGDSVMEEIVTIGTRSAKPRTVVESTVPIDVISAEDLNALGNTADLTDNLKAYVPSYTATPATGDGSAFVRPTSLRGTAPDQVLVLVDGKRRHRSSLLHFFAPAAGNGAHGVDIGMIPGIALKSVEVLRDGAASQYGSDAIAGVINFITRDANEGGEIQVQYGQHYEGEDSMKFSGNIGFNPGIGDNSFINASIEYIENDALSRGIQRPDAQIAINSGNTAVGQDAPFGDAPLAQTWGRPETQGTRVFVNSGFDISDTQSVYLRGSYADTDGRYRFFYRNPCHSSLATLGAACPGVGAPGTPGEIALASLPGGYTPFLDGAQTDYSIVAGVEGEFTFTNKIFYDLSISYGANELDYILNNTTNPSLGVNGAGEPVQRDFDVGGYDQEELTLNADFSMAISDTLNLGFGGEFRDESYTIIAGEANAQFGSGSNGFAGIKDSASGKFSRDNYAFYGDLEHDISDAFLMQYALRFEEFSDFGSTLNWKVAGRYTLTDDLTFRAAASTGFHAPTPAQINISTTITTFDTTSGVQVEEGLIPSIDPRVAGVGGTALTEETSLNFSAGFAANLFDNTSLTLDAYLIQVDDRIYKTGDIQDPTTTNPLVTIAFYTNALDVEHWGIDLVATTGFDWNNDTSTDLSLAYGYNQVTVTGQKLVGGIRPVSDAIIEDIQNNYPKHRWTLTGNTLFGDKINLIARLNFYGTHFDERGTINGHIDGGLGSAEIDSIVYLDMELGYQATDNLRIVGGGSNILDTFIDTIGVANDNRLSVGLQYPRRTASNYEGGSWYLKGIWSF